VITKVQEAEEVDIRRVLAKLQDIDGTPDRCLQRYKKKRVY
jgi:hypothetical protein